MSTRRLAIRTALEGIYWTGAHRWLRPVLGGVGAILTMHHVRPPRLGGFQPNMLLEITSVFLDAVIRRLKRARIDIVSLDEMHRRLVERDFRRRFVCLTLDDGYRDNKVWAYPVLKKHDVPFAIYIPTSFPDRLGMLWWLVLEEVIATHERIGLVIDDKDRHFDCRTTAEKREVYNAIYWWMRGLPHAEDIHRVARDLARRHGVDPRAICTRECMDWKELADFAADPALTIGAHTVNHYILKKLDENAARTEMAMSVKVIEASLGKAPEHFAYPVGDKTSAGPREFALAAQLGFKTAVTTRPGVVYGAHRDYLTALPRISLNGHFQQIRYMRALISGVPTVLMNGLRGIDVD